MAEERLIDDDKDIDKDKKYRFRINEDGEEVLEIYGGDEEEEDAVPEDELTDSGFEVPEFEEDDEEAAAMTPEELFAERRRQEEERLAHEKKADELIEKALSLRAEGNDSYAVTTLDSAQKECPERGEIYLLKLDILSKGFTDVTRLEECEAVSDGFANYASAEDRARVSEKFAPFVKEALAAQNEENRRLEADNEQKKSERRTMFKARFFKTLRNLLFAFVPFLAFLIAGIALTPQMYSDKNGTMLAITIVMYSLAGVAFIASVILARFFATAVRRLVVNENNSSTALGRAYSEGLYRAAKLESLYSNVNFVSADGGNDL